MSTKTITIMDDAYELLARNKLEGESFSQTLRRTLSKKRDISEFAGVWSEEFANKVKESIAEGRKRGRERAKRRDAEFIALTRRS